jgi:glycosyltransferase involved in cell wall biosynthesis
VNRLATVVVPAHKFDDRLLALLHALDQQVGDGSQLPVVVSDDAAREPLGPRLEAVRFPNLQLSVVRSDVNGGPGAARNRALGHVRTPWVAFLDSDELPRDGWLARVEEIAGERDAPDAVKGMLDVGDDRPTPFSHYAETTVVAGDVALAVAGNVVFRSDVLREVGGFDERFYDPAQKLHFREDSELFFRLEARGKRIVFDPLLRAHHPPLARSFWSPILEARRYYFDPLLSREHPRRFRVSMRERGLGPLSLRRARHDAALAFVLGTGVACAGVALESRRATGAGIGLLVFGWTATAIALGWKRLIRARDVPPLAAVAAIVPWVYLWHYYRGVLRFRHRSRF